MSYREAFCPVCGRMARTAVRRATSGATVLDDRDVVLVERYALHTRRDGSGQQCGGVGLVVPTCGNALCVNGYVHSAAAAYCQACEAAR